MFILAKLVFESYIPDTLDKGMLFKQRIKDVLLGKRYEYDRIFVLNHIPNDRESYIIANGYPVRPTIVSITSNPDNTADVLATAEQIGWWDAEPWNDEADLRDIEVKDFNYILEEEDGYIEIEVNSLIDENDHDIIVPVLYINKCTLRVVQDEEDNDYDEEDDYEDDWDDMDDLTDYDNPEWTHDHPKDKTDHDPED